MIKCSFNICTLYRDINRYQNLVINIINAGFHKSRIFGLDNTRNCFDCYSAIRKFLSESQSDFTIICHDDVSFEKLNQKMLIKQITDYLTRFPRAAVFGIAGRDSRIIGGQGHFIGSHGEEKWGFDLTRDILSLDECFLIVKNGLNIMVGEGLEGYHFYGTDLCLQARKMGYSSHVIDFPIRHESSGTIKEDFFYAKKNYEKYLNKNADKLFIPTTCTLLYSGNNIFLQAFSDAFSIIILEQSNHKDLLCAEKCIRENWQTISHQLIFQFTHTVIKIYYVLTTYYIKLKIRIKYLIKRIQSDFIWWKKNWIKRLFCFNFNL